MRQLVQLHENADQFKEAGAQLLFVFREEGEGVAGLEKIHKRHKTDFLLAIDPNKKSTKSYSNGRMEFDNYVIDSDGILRAKIDGTKTTRATAKQLLTEFKKLDQGK